MHGLAQCNLCLLEVIPTRQSSFSLVVQNRDHIGDGFRYWRNLPGCLLIHPIDPQQLTGRLVHHLADFDIM